MASAPAGSVDFAQLDAFRPALVGYCYRMLGSVFEAEDAVQEAMVRAWQSADGFEGRASARTWLYRIATNICLDVLRGRARRAVPMDLGPASAVAAIVEVPRVDRPWLTPIPDPAEAAVSKESIRLAFVAAIQFLPPRQRAVLILRDALGWSAAEVAELLGSTMASVNSALQRARGTLASRADVSRPAPDPEVDRELVASYVDAFERYDIEALVALLHEDAVQTMPPHEVWLRGANEIAQFMLGPGAHCRGSRLIPTVANGAPAFGQYHPDGAGGFHPWALVVVDIGHGRIGGLHFFVDPPLFPVFGLPTVL
jgi:RNA polymerase sigma-70 factor (ECF subfamily)